MPNYELKYTKGRLEEKLTFRDFIGLRTANDDAILTVLAAHLWDNDTEKYVEMEKAKEFIMDMPLKTINQFSILFNKEFTIDKLFDPFGKHNEPNNSS